MAAYELDAIYVLTGPDGQRAVFNDQSDPDYVGVITEVSGLDSPEVRENADNLVQFDGGIHGDFFWGRRPVVLNGLILNPQSPAERNVRQNKLERASAALRGDAELKWTLSGGEQQFILVRRQQPVRVTGAWQKTFQIPLVSADPRIYNQNQSAATVMLSSGDESVVGRGYDMVYDKDYGPAVINGQVTAANNGTADTYPLIVVEGPVVNPTIINFTTGQGIYLTYTLQADETLSLDALNRTVMLNGTSPRYGAIDQSRTNWWALVPGDNDLRLAATSFSAGASLDVTWRDAWV